MSYPHVTVATIVERDNRFLMVRERSNGKLVMNQPAGHLELNETLIEAAVRETLEETCWHVSITGFLGVGQFIAPNGITYIRNSFVANAEHFDEQATLDKDIVEAVWLTEEEIHQERDKLRSPMVLNDIQRYKEGKIYTLELVTHLDMSKG